MGEYYAAFKINGVENFESNTYDLKYDDQKIEVKQIEKSSHPSDPAKKGRLTKMDSFGSLLSILTWLRKLKKSDKDGDWEKFQTERPDLKKVLDQIYDPKHEQEEELFTKLGYIDIQNLAGRIKADVLFFTGMMDMMCPPSSQFAAYNKINSNKKMNIYPDFGHEGIPGSNDEIFEFLMGV